MHSLGHAPKPHQPGNTALTQRRIAQMLASRTRVKIMRVRFPVRNPSGLRLAHTTRVSFKLSSRVSCFFPRNSLTASLTTSATETYRPFAVSNVPRFSVICAHFSRLKTRSLLHHTLLATGVSYARRIGDHVQARASNSYNHFTLGQFP